MSVLACDRAGCENVMCDRLILDGQAYICDECFEELKIVKSTWCYNLNGLSVREGIEYFMMSRKNTQRSVQPPEVEEEFKRLTGG
jgi:hypothetical protein